MKETVKTHLRDAGVSEPQAMRIVQLYESGETDDALKKMKVIRCEYMEELHKQQWKLDCLDSLIRNTEKEIENRKREGIL